MTADFDNLIQSSDVRLMREAIVAARFACELDEVPVGAIVVDQNNEILAIAGNRTRTDCDPTAHAEILAIRKAAWVVGNYRLTGATLYSTLEPCAMCAGALIQARIKRLVYGTPDERFGAVRSRFAICDNGSLNHKIEIVNGVLENECKQLMQDFFQQRRNEGKRKGKRQKFGI